MSEALPDPMPEHPADREVVEGLVHDMDVQQAEEGEAEANGWVLDELDAGRTPREILDELGNEAPHIIGPGLMAELETADGEVADQAELVAHQNENDVWVEILEMLADGATDQDLVDAFIERGGLERLIGSDSAKRIMDKAKKENTNG